MSSNVQIPAQKSNGFYDEYNFRQQKQQNKRKSFDNPVVNEASEIKFHKPNTDYLLNL